jgi:glycine/D-amino acid oxidase-like deaminating enzyme
MTERVLVIGAGMAGLWSAMALASPDREIMVLDRDPGPPDGGAEAAFADWQRRGVGHIRHSHAFLARLRTLVRDEHPQLLEDLKADGCRELGFEGGLTEWHKASGYSPQPIDADLAILTSRRTTLELAMRRYAERLPGVTFRPQTFVRALKLTPERPAGGRGRGPGGRDRTPGRLCRRRRRAHLAGVRAAQRGRREDPRGL